MKRITKLKLNNFKRFPKLEIELYDDLNIIVGENEAGKSSILTAINLVFGGSRNKVETIGIERLLNTDAVRDFLKSDRSYDSLPQLFVEVYFNEQNNHELSGNINSELRNCDGLRMECAPNDELSGEIKAILSEENCSFPFEYYQVNFKTFSGESYSAYRKYIGHILVDNTLVGHDYATREYVSDMYNAYAIGAEKNKHQHEYRMAKSEFSTRALTALNSRITNYAFSVKHDNRANLLTDLTLSEDQIGIDNKGKGLQCFIKTEFALNRAHEGHANGIDVALIEEPENHLSHVNMKKLILKIAETNDKQLIIATHNNLVSARLDLRKTILLHSSSRAPAVLSNLSEGTAKYFMKAPDHRVLDFVLAKKTILVEGDSEFILLSEFFRRIAGAELEKSEVQVLSVNGTSFKRFLEISKLLKIKTAVIRDNDGDFEANCVTNFRDYASEHIRVFADPDDRRKTFEICLYEDNEAFCNDIFGPGRQTLSVQEYMLNNKTETAFQILLNLTPEFSVPDYLKQAIEWIRE